MLAGSHREGLVEEVEYGFDATRMKALSERYRAEAPLGPAGSVIFFDAVTLHASPTNISTKERTLTFVTYNRVDNHPPEFDDAHPEFVSSRDYSPLEVVYEDRSQ
jgi:ectoine hydroxylase